MCVWLLAREDGFKISLEGCSILGLDFLFELN